MLSFSNFWEFNISTHCAVCRRIYLCLIDLVSKAVVGCTGYFNICHNRQMEIDKAKKR